MAPPIEAAPIEAPIEAEPVAAPSSPAAAPLPPAPQGDDGADALIRAQPRRCAPRKSTVMPQGRRRASPLGRRLSTTSSTPIPGVTEHKRRFLRENPNLLQPANVDTVRFHYQSALSAGVADDTPEMNEAILSGLKRERERAVNEARSIVESGPPAPRRPSLPMSAPVSRDVPSYATGRAVPNKMTLTPAEVDIAHRSFVDRPDMPRMTPAEKEYAYALQKRRYLQAKADGSYSEQGGRSPTFRAGHRDGSG